MQLTKQEPEQVAEFVVSMFSLSAFDPVMEAVFLESGLLVEDPDGLFRCRRGNSLIGVSMSPAMSILSGIYYGSKVSAQSSGE